MPQQTVEEAIATSPRHYAYPFKSHINRFANTGPERESLHLTYDINAFDTSTSALRSPRRYAAVFRKPDEHRHDKLDLPFYDTDAGHKASVAKRAEKAKRNYSFNHTSPRFAKGTGDFCKAEFYHTDVLHKQSLATGIDNSPIRYKSVEKGTPRKPLGSSEVHGDYRPTNHEMGRRIAESPRRYAIMHSVTERNDPASHHKLHDGVYDIDRLAKISVAKLAEVKPGCKSAFVARPRLPLTNITAGPDKMYDPDCGSKTTLWKNVQDSGIHYSGMVHSARAHNQPASASAHLEYFTDDNPLKPTVAYGILCSPRRYATMGTATPRFNSDAQQPSHLQALYDPDSAPHGEGSVRKRVMESPRRYFGAQSLADRGLQQDKRASHNLHYDPNYGKTKTVADCVLESPFVLSTMRSQIPRFKTEKRAAQVDEYEQLLRNPDKIELKFQIRGNIVVKKTSTAPVVVGRQAPPTT